MHLKKSFTAIASAALSILVFRYLTGDPVMANVIVATLFIHELGHWLVLRAFRYKAWMIFVPPLGAVVVPEKAEEVMYEITRGEDLAFSLAGTFMNILVCLVCIRLSEIAEWNKLSIMVGTLNAQLVLLNLIPISPLDGGRVLRALIGSNRPLSCLLTIFSISAIIALYWLSVVPWWVFVYLMGVQLILGVANVEGNRQDKSLSRISALASITIYLVLVVVAIVTLVLLLQP